MILLLHDRPLSAFPAPVGAEKKNVHLSLLSSLLLTIFNSGLSKKARICYSLLVARYSLLVTRSFGSVISFNQQPGTSNGFT
jgi:hypothetical protein